MVSLALLLASVSSVAASMLRAPTVGIAPSVPCAVARVSPIRCMEEESKYEPPPDKRNLHPRQGGQRLPQTQAQFGFKVQKSERLLIREAWERADAYRPGKPNWFTQQQKDLRDLHDELLPKIDELPSVPGAGLPGAGNVTSLIGALLKSLTTGDLALTLCSKEPPVLTQLRDWLVEELTMPEAVRGLPEEQGRVLSTLARAMDARKMLDLGTFTGYSSIAMALATADDARVICCEPDTKFSHYARDWWTKAGCAGKMEMHVRGTRLIQLHASVFPS
jgi:hypothetical protein